VPKIEKTMIKKGSNTALLFGLGLYGRGRKGLLKDIRRELVQGKKLFIATPNPEFIVFAAKNKWFKRALLKANFLIPDGIGLVLAAKLLLPKKKQFRETITGVDLTEDLCQLAAQEDLPAGRQGLSVYFLGSEVAGKALARMKRKYPRLRGWAESGPALKINKSTGEWRNRDPIARLVKEIRAKKPDFLFVALGMGKQEKFIVDCLEKLPVRLTIGIGGAFDYLSLKVKRPPLWLRKLGLEWLYRLLKQPWRIKRQLALVEFSWLVVRQRLFKPSSTPGV